VAKKQRTRERRPYRDPAPARGTPAGGRSRRTTRATESGGLPLLPITIGGLALGILAVAFVAFSNSAPSPQPSLATLAALATPDGAFPAENADMSLGSSAAPVTLDEWADFQCPGCKFYTRQTEPLLVDTYVKTGKVRIVFHDFPFIPPVQQSVSAATAARCAGQQHRFWEYHGYLYANQGREGSGWVTTAVLDQIARAVGLDQTAFDLCLADTAIQQQIIVSRNQGQQLGLTSTPTLILNGQTIEGPNNTIPSWDQLRGAIDQLLGGQ
jgi:protein-disulfide isomerase